MPNWFWPESKSENSGLVRLGRLLHWIGYGWAGIAVAMYLFNYDNLHDPWAVVIAGGIAALIGRAARYLLASE